MTRQPTKAPAKPGDDWSAPTLFYVSERVRRLYGMSTLREPLTVRGVLSVAVRFGNRGKASALGEAVFQKLLRIAVEGPSLPGDEDLAAPSEELLAQLRLHLAGLTWRQSLERAASGITLAHHAFIEEQIAFIGVVMMLLMDESNRALIGRCRYCGKFFLVPRQSAGRPADRYCNERHRTKQNDRESAQRQLLSRARRRLEKRYGREASRDAVQRAARQHPEIRAAAVLAERALAVLQNARSRLET